MKKPSAPITISGLALQSAWFLAALFLMAALTPSAQAASATWLAAPFNNNWVAAPTTNNWSTGVGTFPGATTGTSSADVATFSNTSSITTVNCASGFVVGGITFDTASASAYTINTSGGTWRISMGSNPNAFIKTTATVVNPQVINGQLRLASTGGATITSDSTTPTATLSLPGGISVNNSGTSGILTLAGANTGNNIMGAYTEQTPASIFGSFVKAGTGTWIMTGNNTIHSNVVINAGTLVLIGAGAFPNSPLITINGGTLSVSNTMTTANTMVIPGSGALLLTNTFYRTPLTVGTLSATNAAFHLGVNGSSPYTSIQVTAAFNAGAGIALDVDQVSQVTGPTTFTLIGYPGSDPVAGNFTVNVPAGYTAGPVTVGGGQVNVTITPPSSTSLVWVGATNHVLVSNWDVTTKDWVDAATLSFLQAYANPDSVQFDDTASSNVVTLSGNVAPQSIAINNNTLNYTFNGTGEISGPTSLVKNGNASLTLAESGGDIFSGGITINAGSLLLDDANGTISGGLIMGGGTTVQIGNNDGSGSLPLGSVDDEGTLVFNRTNTILVTSVISGNGALIQNGSGTLILSNASSYYGNTYVSKGTLALSGSGTISNTASLLVSNATFDVSGVAGQTALLYGLTVTNATFNVAFAGAEPPPAITVLNGFYADGISSVSNVINVTSLPVISSYPATLTVINSAGISLANGNFNFILGRLPSASPAYAGTLSESADTTSLQLTLTSGPVGTRPSVFWVGTDNVSVTTNWSDRLDWQLPGAPLNTDNVVFNNTAVVGAGTVNNLVDQNFTVASLIYTNIGNGNYHVTDIPAGITLTVTNFSAGGLTQDNAITDVAFTDGGTLLVNGPSLTVGNNGVGSTDTGSLLDLSGLSNFVYAATSGTINQGTGNRSAANFNLAGVSNSITASTWNANALSTSSSASGTLTLGAGTNNLNVGTFNIALQRNNCTVKFPSSGGGLRLRGLAGTDASRATMTLGNRQAGGSGGTSAGTLSFNGNAVDMKLGTLTMGQAGSVSANIGNGVINFDTGTIDATTINMATVTVAGATANGTITEGANGTLIAGPGGISLVSQTAGTGTGTLTINGGTVISSNSIIKGTVAGTANINLNGGTLNVVNGTIGTSASPIDNLTLNGGILQLNVSMNVTDVVATAVSASSLTIINIGAFTGVIASTPIPLISYGSSSSDPYPFLSLGSVPAGFTGGSLVDDTANFTIDLVITPPSSLVWAGAVGSVLNNNWDFSTADWKHSGASTAYADPDYTYFDDSASNSTVTVAGTVSPGVMSFNNSALNYVINGNGAVSGTGGLIKQGSGKLTLDNSGANNFSGGLTISSGAVQVGNNDNHGSLPAGGVTDNGSLVFDQNVNATVANVLSGSGTFSQIGTATVTLSANNTNLAGGIQVTNGILSVTASTALGALASITVVTNTGTYDVNGLALNAVLSPRLLISGVGFTNGGAIINSGVAQQNAFSNVTLSANVTLGGNNRWDIRAATGTAASLNTSPAGSAYSITKVGPNEVALVSVGTIDAALGDIYVQQGEFALQTGTVSPGNPSANIIVSAGAELEMFQLANPLNKVITLNGNGASASFSADSGTAAQNVEIGPVTLNGNCLLNVATGVFSTFGGVISGAGSLIKTTTGTLTLTNINTYAGSTTISNGTLALTGSGSIGSSPTLTVAAGAVLAVNGRSDGTLTLNSGQTLTGGGSVGGSVTNLPGSTVSPNGVLTVSNSVSLAGNTLLNLNITTNDVLTSGATLTYGGTLTLTNASATPLTLGATFKLFNASSYAGAFSSIVTQPALSAGLGWMDNGNGSFSVVNASASVSHLTVTGFNLSGPNVVFNGTNAGSGTVYVLMATNLTQPLGQWLPVATNTLSGGSFSLTATNAANPLAAQRFYILSTTNN